jgi:hypothetical protein
MDLLICSGAEQMQIGNTCNMSSLEHRKKRKEKRNIKKLEYYFKE